LPAGAGPTSAAIAQLDGAIAAAMPNFGPLLKDAENTYLKTSYLPLDTLLEDIRPALIAQGILITSAFQLVPGGFVVVTTLAHSGGGWRSSMFPVGDPSNPQKVAAAATYGLRVNLCQLLALVGRDDDGHQAAPQPPAAQQWTAPPGQPLPQQQWNQQPAPQQPPGYGQAAPPQQPPADAPPVWQPPAAPQSAPNPYV
jgi:hypothetical protein